MDKFTKASLDFLRSLEEAKVKPESSGAEDNAKIGKGKKQQTAAVQSPGKVDKVADLDMSKASTVSEDSELEEAFQKVKANKTLGKMRYDFKVRPATDKDMLDENDADDLRDERRDAQEPASTPRPKSTGKPARVMHNGRWSDNRSDDKKDTELEEHTSTSRYGDGGSYGKQVSQDTEAAYKEFGTILKGKGYTKSKNSGKQSAQEHHAYEHPSGHTVSFGGFHGTGTGNRDYGGIKMCQWVHDKTHGYQPVHEFMPSDEHEIHHGNGRSTITKAGYDAHKAHLAKVKSHLLSVGKPQLPGVRKEEVELNEGWEDEYDDAPLIHSKNDAKYRAQKFAKGRVNKGSYGTKTNAAEIDGAPEAEHDTTSSTKQYTFGDNPFVPKVKKAGENAAKKVTQGITTKQGAKGPKNRMTKAEIDASPLSAARKAKLYKLHGVNEETELDESTLHKMSLSQLKQKFFDYTMMSDRERDDDYGQDTSKPSPGHRANRMDDAASAIDKHATKKYGKNWKSIKESPYDAIGSDHLMRQGGGSGKTFGHAVHGPDGEHVMTHSDPVKAMAHAKKIGGKVRRVIRENDTEYQFSLEKDNLLWHYSIEGISGACVTESAALNKIMAIVNQIEEAKEIAATPEEILAYTKQFMEGAYEEGRRRGDPRFANTAGTSGGRLNPPEPKLGSRESAIQKGIANPKKAADALAGILGLGNKSGKKTK